MDDIKYKLYHWQEKCLEQWLNNDCRGIVNVATGAGKTMLALAAVEKLEKELDIQPLKVKIIVPKTFLMRQWQSALRENLGIPREEIGFYSGAHKDNPTRKYMIYVINSARYSITKHITDDYKASNHIFLIADECHHYGTEQNSKIFGYKEIITNYTKFYTLGLSATPYSSAYDNILVPNLGPEIYSFTFISALKADIISNFAIFNICVSFNKEERTEYDDLTEKLGVAMFRLKQRCPWLHSYRSRRFFSALESIINSSDTEASDLALSAKLLSFRRKETVYLAKSRIECVIDLVKLICKTSKIIIFGERIDTAQEIYERLALFMPNEVGIYHSKQNKTAGRINLRQYENHEIRVLISCKTLDEGLNISEADVGIIVSSTGSNRQRIQRLGRILRKKSQNRMAYLYYLFVDNTSEEDEMLNETNGNISSFVNVIDVYYDDKMRLFSNRYFDKLITSVFLHTQKKPWDERKKEEFLKNAERGLLTCDWLIPEKECIRKISLAVGKSERNYFITMLLLIRARLNIYNE